ncbi:MAG: hypothetical protein QW303_02560 [Nitrososphaerota archaeon]
MDPGKKFQKEFEYYEYVENQRRNYIDLTQQENSNDSVKQLAYILFKKPVDKLDQELTGILLDERMETADIFCMLVELVLYGLDILSDGRDQIFSLNEPSDDGVCLIKAYLRSAGFDIEIREDIFSDKSISQNNRDDYYCEIIGESSSSREEWHILRYRIRVNDRFRFTKNTPLEKFGALFTSSNNKIFIVNFKYVIRT